MNTPNNWHVLGALASMRFEVEGTGGNCTAGVGTAAGLRLNTTTLRTDEGAECSFADFVRDNLETLDGATIATIGMLRIGETYSEPAGGSAAWSVTRVA